MGQRQDAPSAGIVDVDTVRCRAAPRPDEEANAMIARTWRGWTHRRDADEYVRYLFETGIEEYRATPGNRAAYILRRDEGDRTEFVTLTFWDSMDAVRSFAGADVDQAVFYPEDDRFLLDRETFALHYEVIEAEPEPSDGPPSAGR